MSFEAAVAEIPAIDHHCHASAYEDAQGRYRPVDAHERTYAGGLVEAKLPPGVYREYLDAQRRGDTDRLHELQVTHDVEGLFVESLRMRSTTVFNRALQIGCMQLHGEWEDRDRLARASELARDDGSVQLYDRALDMANCPVVLTDVPQIDRGRWSETRYRWISRIDPLLYPFGPDVSGRRGVETESFARRFADTLTHLLELQGLDEVPGELGDYLDFVERSLADTVRRGAVGFKIVSAYVRGLDFVRTDRDAAQTSWKSLQAGEVGAGKDLEDYLAFWILEWLAERGLPVQVHIGMGHAEPGMRFRDADPFHLQAVLDDPRLGNLPVVLIHGGYPYASRAATLAHAYGNVHLDFSWMTYLHHHHLIDRLSEWLELLPANKLMIGSDTGLPEVHLGAIRLGRIALTRALERGLDAGIWRSSQAEWLAGRALHANLTDVYGL